MLLSSFQMIRFIRLVRQSCAISWRQEASDRERKIAASDTDSGSMMSRDFLRAPKNKHNKTTNKTTTTKGKKIIKYNNSGGSISNRHFSSIL
jgi:RNA polymerase-interacting CarD/CdnL/TRCF family regulator